MFAHMRERFAEHRSCHGGDMAEFFAMRGGPFRRGPGRGGPGEGRGFGDGDGDGFGESGRVGRLLLQGDLRLLVLSLIEKEPRHGYEIIKHIEDLTGGFYAPSPGVVYPTLTYLEEAGYIVAEAEGNKKRYSITVEGRDYLKDNSGFAAEILGRLASVGEKLKRRREWMDGRHGGNGGPQLPRSLDAALLNLREVLARRLEADERLSGDFVRLLLEFADRLETLERRED